MFVISQQRLIESMSGTRLQKHGKEGLKGIRRQEEGKAFRKHQLTAGEAATTPRMFVLVLLSAVIPLPSTNTRSWAALASRQASNLESDWCRKIGEDKETRAPLGPERSWNPEQNCLLD